MKISGLNSPILDIHVLSRVQHATVFLCIYSIKSISMKVICVLLSTISTFWATQSFCQLRIKNSTADVVYTSIAYSEFGNWYTEGYWPVNPWQTITVYTKKLVNRYYYIRAEGENSVWEGNTTLYVNPTKAFKVLQGSVSNSTRFTTAKFFEVDTNIYYAFTLELTPKAVFPSSENVHGGMRDRIEFKLDQIFK